jgi:hypothetical protein
MIELQYNDGGREAAGFKGSAGDCACRATAIASGLTYTEVYDALNEHAKSERISKHKKARSSARDGMYRRTMHRYLLSIGFTWTATMFIGQGCKVHLKAEELPKGRLIVSLSGHYAAVIDGVLHDTYDCSREGTRCVYGYYKLENTEGGDAFACVS